MPPNQDPNNQQTFPQPAQTAVPPEILSPSPYAQPAQVVPSAAASAPTPAGPGRTKKLMQAAVAVVVVIGLGTGVYAYQKSSSSKKKFNDLALAIKNQEVNGAKNYTASLAVLNDVGNSISLAGSANADSLKQKTDEEIASFQKIVDKSCSDVNSDLTAAKIDDQSKDLKLSADQKKYLSDMKDVINQLESTEYSNKTTCAEGPIMLDLAKNLVNFMPGITMLTSLTDTPTAAQLAQLKSFTTMSIENQTELQKKLPSTTQFLVDLKTMLADLYYEYSALNSGDSASVLSYASKIESLSNKFQTDTDNLTAEINSLDKKSNDKAIAASKAEIAAIDYQKAHNTSNPNMQLDYALPAFRIADAAISNYDDQHSKYPLGTSIDVITNLDSNLKALKDKGGLEGLTYSSLGSDQSGYSLSAKLSDGSNLSEKVDASTSQNI